MQSPEIVLDRLHNSCGRVVQVAGLRKGALASYAAAGNIGWGALEASAFDEDFGLLDAATDFIPGVNAAKAWIRVGKLGCF